MELKIIIPDDISEEVFESLASSYGYQPVILLRDESDNLILDEEYKAKEINNPETAIDFVHRKWHENIESIVTSERVRKFEISEKEKIKSSFLASREKFVTEEVAKVLDAETKPALIDATTLGSESKVKKVVKKTLIDPLSND